MTGGEERLVDVRQSHRYDAAVAAAAEVWR